MKGGSQHIEIISNCSMNVYNSTEPKIYSRSVCKTSKSINLPPSIVKMMITSILAVLPCDSPKSCDYIITYRSNMKQIHVDISRMCPFTP